MASQNMITLKLLIDMNAQIVLFAEASKEFVDFLFHIFSLPLGTLIEFIGSKQMVGCLGKLKDSIDSFNVTYLQAGVKKHDIFNPKTPFSGNTILFSYDDKPVTSRTLYGCSSFHDDELGAPSWLHHLEEESSDEENCDDTKCEKCVSEHEDATCPSCKSLMNVPLTIVCPSNKTDDIDDLKKNEKKSREGYVKDLVTYMVMDDLVVKPMSTISTITLINSFGVKDFSHLEEKMVVFDKNEAFKMLKTSLMTDQVLTTLFLQNTSA